MPRLFLPDLALPLPIVKDSFFVSALGLVVTLLVLAQGMPTHHFVFLRLLNSSSTSGWSL